VFLHALCVFVSVPTRKSNCLSRVCLVRDPGPESTRPNDRENTDRGSPPPPCPSSPEDGAPTRPRIPRPSGWSAHPTKEDPASEGAAGKAPPDVSLHRKGGRSWLRLVAGEALPSRSPVCDRFPSPRHDRSSLGF